jgi:molybdate transport system substrate-binding protein
MISAQTLGTAADVKVLAGAAFSPALAELGPEFERATGHRLSIHYGIAGTLKQKIEGEEVFDVFILPVGLLDEATKRGKIVAGTQIVVAHVGMGVAVRRGATKPTVNSVEAFKQALMNANSVTYPPQGTVGIHLTRVFDNLGIVEQMKSKIKPQETVERVPLAVAAGEAELGFAPSTVLLSGTDVDFVGLFPADLQTYLVYAMGVGTAAKEPDAAKSLITHLAAPNTLALIKAKGFMPGTP